MPLSEEEIFIRIMTSRRLREWTDVRTALDWVQQETCITYVWSDGESINTADCNARFQIKWIGDRYVVGSFNLNHNHARPLYPGWTILMKESITAGKERKQSSSDQRNSLKIQDQLAHSNDKTLNQVISSITQNSYVAIESNELKQLTHISMARYEAIETYRLYPEVVLLSATHNVTTTRKASVFQFIVIDGFGYAKPIMYCMSTIQQQDVLSIFLKHFSRILRNLDKTRTFIMDCGIVQLDCVKEIFPKAKILFSPLIVEKAFSRKCNDPTATAIFHAIITTQSRLQFDYFIERLKYADLNAYNYMMNRWMPMKSNWAVSFYSDQVITLGVNVIDIIKSVNPSIKESLRKLTDIKDCLTVLYNEAEKHWISPNRINLPHAHCIKTEESNDNSNNNKSVIPEKLKSILNQLTDYAADMMYHHSIRMNEIHVDFINSDIALCTDDNSFHNMESIEKNQLVPVHSIHHLFYHVNIYLSSIYTMVYIKNNE
ncbi:unnamed protein product [Trichobilharzia szidati]|nr:unnamed protein product [Trichobilharzia szidati]